MKKSKENILQYILNCIYKKDKEFVKKTCNYFKIANSTVYNYLKELIENGIIEKTNNNNFKYLIASKKNYFSYKLKDHLEEDRVFDKDIAPLFSDMNKNVFEAWRYAFTEMMNNAIEHSSAENIYCRVSTNFVFNEIAIIDDGIGIFKNIQTYFKNNFNSEIDLSECVSLLFAGKFTTATEGHSGEGIFFTSHIMDEFLIVSDGKRFTRDNFSDLVENFDMARFDINAKTLVCMRLFNSTKKTIKEVFDRFSDMESGFYKTHIPIAHVFPNGTPVSRSEARRLCSLFTEFKEVNLDFYGVEQLGQAFVHEIFVVWQKRNPEIKINVENANENISDFIKRVINTK
ncbi:MAG: DUF4325 domain-containing protein [Ruminococcaceae bacterium]|nr:DUF4325 domain-containing protein [Oscillospiraceae bacterium]